MTPASFLSLQRDRNLSLVVRDDSDHCNCFARLSQAVAKQLHSDACTVLLHHGQPEYAQDVDRLVWSVSIPDGNNLETPKIEFLPLAVTFSGEDCAPVTIYTSYNGGDFNSIIASNDQIIELPRSLVALDPSKVFWNVVVHVLPWIFIGARVQLEPLTIEDWDLMEAHAEWLEGGGLLQQISVVCPYQVLSIRFDAFSDDIARVKVVQVESRLHGDGADLDSAYDVWPNDVGTGGEVSDQQSSPAGPSCVLLVQDTEVLVAPQTRKRQNLVTPPLRLIPSTADLFPVMRGLANELDQYHGLQQGETCSSMTVPTCCILVHESVCVHFGTTVGEELQWAWVLSEESRKQKSGHYAALVRVIPRTRLSPSDVALHPLTRLQLGKGFGVYWSTIRLEFIPQQQLSGMIHRLNANRSLLDQFGLETVQIDWDTPPSWLSQEWHRADCCSTTGRQPVEGISLKSPTMAPCDDENQTLLQIGSLLQMAPTANSLEQACDGGKSYRLVCRNNSFLDRLGQASAIFAFSKDDLAYLFRIENTRNNPMESIDNTRTDTRSVVAAPGMDVVVNLLPDVLFLSPMSAKTWTGERLGEFFLDFDFNRTTTNILCGRRGSGKTHVALLMAARSRLRPPHRATLYLDCKRLQQSSLPLSEILFQLQITFERAIRGHPCTIVLDELDRLAPNLLSHAKHGDNSTSRVQATSPVALDQSKIVTDHLLLLIQALGHTGRNFQTKNGSHVGAPDVSFVITCDSVESLHPDLLRSTIGECRIIQVPVLTISERDAVLGKMIRCGVSVEEWESVDHTRIARLSEGFRPRDLEKLASLVLLSRVTKRDLGSLDLVFQTACHELVQLSHSSLVNTERQRGSGPNWQCLGGLFRVKAKLSSTILHPAKYRRIYDQARIRLPRGVLLFGPTGCGKSVLVPALAQACNFPLIICNGPSVLDKYIGASEMKVRELFARAADVAPSILFLDELDSLAPRRGSDHMGVTDRVVNQLLTFLDGVEDMPATGTVYVIAATSRPDKVDPALLRPGRLEQHVFVGPPESEEEWTDLFCRMANTWSLSLECKEAIASQEFVKEIFSAMPHAKSFSAADFKAVLDTAHVNAVHEALKAVSSPSDLNAVTIELSQLYESLSRTRPCLSRDDALMLQEVYRVFMKNDVDVFDDRKESLRDLKALKTTLR